MLYATIQLNKVNKLGECFFCVRTFLCLSLTA